MKMIKGSLKHNFALCGQKTRKDNAMIITRENRKYKVKLFKNCTQDVWNYSIIGKPIDEDRVYDILLGKMYKFDKKLQPWGFAGRNEIVYANNFNDLRRELMKQIYEKYGKEPKQKGTAENDA